MRNSSVRRINNAVRRLDLALVENVLNPPDGSDGDPFELCAATRDDWNRYVQSEQQALGSRWMAWWDDRVFIVELPESLHEDLVDGVRHAITEATGTGRTHLAPHGAAYIGNRATLPDDIDAVIAFERSPIAAVWRVQHVLHKGQIQAAHGVIDAAYTRVPHG